MFNLFLFLAIGYELQKLIQFSFFFRLRSLVYDYPKKVQHKVKTVVFKELLKITLIEVCYLLILFVGLFTINLYFVCVILFLSFIQNIIFKKIKNKNIRKISFTLDILFSIVLLSLSIIQNLLTF